MKALIRKKLGQSAILYTLGVFLLSLGISVGVVIYSMSLLIEGEKEKVSQTAFSQAGRIEQTIEKLLYMTRTVDALVREGDGEIQDFDRMMKVISNGYQIKNIALAPDGIVTKVYPMEGNEASIGHRLFEDPERRAEAVKARNSGKLTLAGPFELKQGGLGAIGRQPVYLEKNNGDIYFWGLVCVTLNFPQALEDAKMENLEYEKYAYELWRFHPDTGEKQIIMHSVKPLAANPQNQSFNLPNSVWTLSLTPEDGWINWGQLIFRSIIALLFSLIVSLLYKNVLELARNRNELNASMKQQTENYRKLNDLNEELRSFRHDIKNHMLAISALLKQEKTDQAKQYVRSISEKLTATAKIVNTENYIFDALLAEKIEKAREMDIHVESEVLIGKQLSIRNEDWISLFGNILDNAVEACEKVKDMVPGISIYIQYTGNILHSRISNSSPDKPVMAGKRILTSKSDVQNHGLGLNRIQSIVKKYDGVLEVKWEDGIYTISFLLFDV